MFCALLTSRYQVSVYRTNGPLVSIYGLFCKYDIFLYRIVMLRVFSLQRTLVPFVVKKINLKPMNSCLLHKISLFIFIVNRAMDTT